LMNEAAGEMIGDVLKVDTDDDDKVIGQDMRIKVKLYFQKPLMRGVTLDLGDEVTGE